MNKFDGTGPHPHSYNSEPKELSASELHILRHSLGISHDPKAKIYRNRFLTTPNTVDYPICERLCDMGYMKKNNQIFNKNMYLFIVTEAGIEKAT